MLPDRVSNPGPLTYESGALPIALRDGFCYYSQNTNKLPCIPKISYRYLKSGIQEFHWKYVLVPADKAASNVVVFVMVTLHYFKAGIEWH